MFNTFISSLSSISSTSAPPSSLASTSSSSAFRSLLPSLQAHPPSSLSSSSSLLSLLEAHTCQCDINSDAISILTCFKLTFAKFLKFRSNLCVDNILQCNEISSILTLCLPNYEKNPVEYLCELKIFSTFCEDYTKLHSTIKQEIELAILNKLPHGNDFELL